MNSDNPTTDSKIATSKSQKTDLTLFHFIRNLEKFCFLGIGNKSSS